MYLGGGNIDQNGNFYIKGGQTVDGKFIGKGSVELGDHSTDTIDTKGTSHFHAPATFYDTVNLGNETSDALTLTGSLILNLPDNTLNALDIQQGLNNYINIATTDTGETLALGSTAIYPTINLYSTLTQVSDGTYTATFVQSEAGKFQDGTSTLYLSNGNYLIRGQTDSGTIDRFTVDASGNVNIGSDDNSAYAYIHSGGVLRIYDTADDRYLEIAVADGAASSLTTTAGDLTLTPASNELNTSATTINLTGGDTIIDVNKAGASTLTIQNDNGSNTANLTVEGDLTVSGNKITFGDGETIDVETTDVLKLTSGGDVRVILGDAAGAKQFEIYDSSGTNELAYFNSDGKFYLTDGTRYLQATDGSRALLASDGTNTVELTDGTYAIDASGNVRIQGTSQLQLRDSNLVVYSSADGQLDIDADTELEITAPTLHLVNSTKIDLDSPTLDLSTQAVSINLAASQGEALQIQSGLLNIDTQNSRVGIGTTSPNYKFDVVGSGRFTQRILSDYLPTSTTDKAIYTQPAATNPSQKWLFDGGSSYSSDGNMMGDTNDYKYYGYSYKFTGLYLAFSTAGVGYNVSAEYSQGSSAWASLTITDDTSNLTGNNNLYFAPPSAWATDTVNSAGPYYWIRLKTTTSPTTQAVANKEYILPAGYAFATYLSSEDTSPKFYVDYRGNVQVTTLLVAKDLQVSGNVESHLIPKTSTTYNLGSTSLYWQNTYTDTLTANNIIATATEIGGTKASDFIINSDNATADTENMTLTFERGTATPNAVFGWDATNDNFTLNSSLTLSSGVETANITLPGNLNSTGGAIQTNSTTRVDNAGNLQNIGTYTAAVTKSSGDVDLWSGTLTNNTSSGTQRGLVLTAGGSGITETGALINFDTSGGGSGTTALLIDGTWTNGLLINSSAGNVGIGTTSPAHKLDVAGNLNVSGYATASASLTIGSYSSTPAGVGHGVFSGNVGIGTSSPIQNLHVEGQCVTGDSILQQVVEESSKLKAQSSKLQLKTKNLQVKDVKGGEYILSLDEETGQIGPAKIKGLLDMGVKPVYKLTTENGKTIKTTGNHSYLLRYRSGTSFRKPRNISQFEGNINQANSNQNQGGGNLSASHDFPESFRIHFETFLSNLKAANKNIIPNNTDLVKGQKFALKSANRANPGVINTKPNQPADKLPQIPETTLNQEALSFLENHINTTLSQENLVVNGLWTKVIL